MLDRSNKILLVVLAAIILLIVDIYKNRPQISILTNDMLKVDTVVVRDTVKVYSTNLVRDTVFKEVRILEFRDSLVEIKTYVPLIPSLTPKTEYKFLKPLYSTNTLNIKTYELKKDWKVGLMLGANPNGGLAGPVVGYKDFEIGYDFLQKTTIVSWRYSW